MKTIIDNKRPGDAVFIGASLIATRLKREAWILTADKELLLAARKEMRVEGGQTATRRRGVSGSATISGDSKEIQTGGAPWCYLTDGEDRASYYTREELVKTSA